MLLLTTDTLKVADWAGPTGLISDQYNPEWAGHFQYICLSPVSNQLSLFEWRRVVVRAAQYLQPQGQLEYMAFNPDKAFLEGKPDLWPGESTNFEGNPGYFRPLRQHVELLRLYGMTLLIPSPEEFPGAALFSDSILRMTGRVDHSVQDHATLQGGVMTQGVPKESSERANHKYGPDSAYRRYSRLEEPESLDDMLFAASRCPLQPGDSVLSLGCNDGRELEIFAQCGFSGLHYLGIDISDEAITEAQRRYPTDNFRFLAADLNRIDFSDYPKFQAIVLFNVLQCTTVDRDRVFQAMLKLADTRSSILISLPNSHFLHGDIARRPLNRKSARHDRSLVHKDLRYLTRAMYRAGFQDIQCFGHYDLFLLARRGRCS